MEKDENIVYIDRKTRVETPEEFCELVHSVRCKPSPFIVAEIDEKNQSIL